MTMFGLFDFMVIAIVGFIILYLAAMSLVMNAIEWVMSGPKFLEQEHWVDYQDQRGTWREVARPRTREKAQYERYRRLPTIVRPFIVTP